MKRVRKIIENFTICKICNGMGNIEIGINTDNTRTLVKCYMCHGTGLRIKKKTFFYPDDREL